MTNAKDTQKVAKKRPKTPIAQHIAAHWPKHPKAMEKLK